MARLYGTRVVRTAAGGGLAAHAASSANASASLTGGSTAAHLTAGAIDRAAASANLSGGHATFPQWRQGATVGVPFTIPNSSLAYAVSQGVMFAAVGDEANNGWVTYTGDGGMVQAWASCVVGKTALYSMVAGGEFSSDNPSGRIELNVDHPRWECLQRSIKHEKWTGAGSIPSTSMWTGTTRNENGTPDGRHTYDSQHFVEGRFFPDGKDRILVISQFAGSGGGKTDSPGVLSINNIESYIIEDNTWDPPGTWPNVPGGPFTYGKPAGAFIPHGCDLATGDIYVPGTDGVYTWLQPLRAATKSWGANIAAGLVYPNAGWDTDSFMRPDSAGGIGMFDQIRRAFVHFNGYGASPAPGTKIQRMTVDGTATIENIPVTLDGARAFLNTYEAGVCHDLDNDRYIIAPTTGTPGAAMPLYAVDPTTGVATLIGTYPTPASGGYLLDRMHYVQKLGGIAIVPDGYNDVTFIATR